MGQKVNPHGLRVGVIKDWDSRWYASEEKVGDPQAMGINFLSHKLSPPFLMPFPSQPG